MGFLKAKLSGSSDGEPILITGTTSTAANTLHTTSTSAGDNTWDEIYVWGYNNGTGSVNLTIEYGSTSHVLVHSLGAKTGNTLILPGTIGNTGLVVKAFKGGSAAVGVMGFVNQISS